MAFFARPNLDNTQFKQLKGGEPLTLSGQTQIATTSGLTLIGDSGTGPAEFGGMYIPIIATGASNNFVLTYDGAEKVIKLKESTASGGSTVYTSSAATTCTVGGLSAGTTIFNCTLDSVLQCILTPTLFPTLTNPSISSFTINPSTTLYEVGTSISVTGTTVLNPGSINPQYPPTASSCRTCGAVGYCYSDFGSPVYCACTNPSHVYTFSTIIGSGVNTASARIYYCDGVQPYDSAGCLYDNPLVSGCTNLCCRNITGVFPWYYGSMTSAPDLSSDTCAQCLITGSTICKCVGTSSGSIVATNYGVTGEYIWFAIPCASTTKTRWQGSNSASNCGTIPGDLFSSECIRSICSTQNCWGTPSSPTCTSPVPYKFYVSNYPTSISYCMTYNN